MKKTLALFVGVLLLKFAAAQNNVDKKSDDLQKDLKAKVEAKDEGWKRGGLLNIGINQAILENWAAGGERLSFAANGQLNAFMTRIKSNTIFENTLDLYYGLNYVASSHFVPRKLDDRIDFSTRYGLQPKSWTVSKNRFKNHTYMTGLFRFQSQFTEGYNYEMPSWRTNPTSAFLAPAYFTLALGAEYRPNNNFSIFFSPLAGKVTLVKERYTLLAPAFGVEQGKTSRFEFGAYLTTKYRTNLTKNIAYNTRVDLYSNYLAKNKTVNGLLVKDGPGNVDVLWDNFFALKISKLIGAGLGFTLFYDNDQPGQKNKKSTDANGIETYSYGPLGWWQLKQVLNLGFSYKL
ncbi:MAG: DUF3078 domain-containing protein [Chitinophagaceae bacterium]|nr:DUF3078 domain-containing protein [Chitinophagaceae bacterium]